MNLARVAAAAVVAWIVSVWFWISVPYTPQYGLAIVVDSLLEAVVYGAIVGAVYTPLTPVGRVA